MKSSVVVKRNVATDRLFNLPIGLEDDAVNHIRLHRVVERLHVRVVGHRTGAVHALHKAQLLQAFTETKGRKLDAAVSVEDEPGSGTSVMDRTIECGQREVGILVLA